MSGLDDFDWGSLFFPALVAVILIGCLVDSCNEGQLKAACIGARGEWKDGACGFEKGRAP